jgi:membrane fusion protein (multidrug efflux system)
MKIRKVSALTIATAAIVMFPSCGGKQEQQEQQAPELSVITVGEENTTLEQGLPTTLQGVNDVEIRPQVQGFLTKVCVQEGQRVSKGQVLFEIDQVSLKAAVDAAQAAVAVVQANVNTAKTNMNNNKMLFEKNIISSAAYQTSVDQYNAAVAQLNQAQANVTSARKNLSYSTVTAPTSGIVGTIDLKEGSLVSPSSLLTILSNNSDMQADFSLNENDLLALTDNGSRSVQEAIKQMPAVKLKLANGEIYAHAGKIVSISGVIDPSTGSAPAKAIFPNPDGMLRSGNTGKIMVPQLRQNVMMIPQSATYEMQSLKFAYVVGDSNKVHSVNITVAPENDGQNYIVTSGLNAGDVVVVEGVGISVKEGMQITPKKSK